MRRRNFIILLGGAVAAWPFTVRAQQGDRIRRIGVHTGTSVDDPDNKARLAAFEQALQQLGWTVDGNVRIDYRFAGGDATTSRKQSGNIGRARAGRHRVHWRLFDRSATSGYLHRAGRVCDRSRSSRLWHRQKSVAAGRQRNWLFGV